MAWSLLGLLVWIPCALSFVSNVVPGLPPTSPTRMAITTTAAFAMRADDSPPSPPPDDSRAAATRHLGGASLCSRTEVLSNLARVMTGFGVCALTEEAFGGPPPALADNAVAATKQSYFRYVPRILEAMDWYQGDLQKAIESEDWSKVSSYFEVVNTARADSSRPVMYQSSSSRMQRELFSPLSVWAQSMSIKGTGKKLRALLAQEEQLEQSMAVLEKAANGKGLKEGESQAQVAMAAWRAGRDALQEYVDVANKGMIRSLRKIDTPFSN